MERNIYGSFQSNEAFSDGSAYIAKLSIFSGNLNLIEKQTLTKKLQCSRRKIRMKRVKWRIKSLSSQSKRGKPFVSGSQTN